MRKNKQHRHDIGANDGNALHAQYSRVKKCNCTYTPVPLRSRVRVPVTVHVHLHAWSRHVRSTIEPLFPGSLQPVLVKPLS